jgi:hypothetical protein
VFQTDDDIRMLGQRQFAQNLRQLGGAEFRRSTRTGGELGESDVHEAPSGNGTMGVDLSHPKGKRRPLIVR